MQSPEREPIIRQETNPKTIPFHPEGYSYVGSDRENHPIFQSKEKIVSGLLSSHVEFDEIDTVRDEVIYEGDAKSFHRTRIKQLPRSESFANSHVGKLIKKLSQK